jgi:dual specificity protein kinase YAK1
MDQQWPPNMEAPASSRQQRYAPQTVPSSHQYAPRDSNSAPNRQSESYAQPPLVNRAPTMPMTSAGMPQGRGHEYGDGDGDINMEDADSYNKQQQQRQAASRGHARMPSAQLAQEESAAAKRYSPMNLTPSSPYAAATPQQQPAYTSYTPQSRTSPVRSNSYMSPTQGYYASPPCRFFYPASLASCKLLC